MSLTSSSFDTMHRGTIHSVSLDYYGRRLATASADQTIRLWDISGEIPVFVNELQGHSGPIWSVVWSHPKYENLLASCSFDHQIFIWKELAVNHWDIIFASNEHASSVNCVSFCPWECGLHLAAASSDSTVSVISYHPEQGNWSRKAFNAHPNGALCVDWSPVSGGHSSYSQNVSLSQTRLATGGCDFQIRIWMYSETTDQWTATHQLNNDKLCMDWIRDVAWRPVAGTSSLLSCSSDGNVIIWMESDDQVWKPKQIINMREQVWKVTWSITGSIIAVLSGLQMLTMYHETTAGTWEKFEQEENSTEKFRLNDLDSSPATLSGN